jgi:hypothetical protein
MNPNEKAEEWASPPDIQKDILLQEFFFLKRNM